MKNDKGGIIIVGVARGGTSLPASICHHLGIWMGKMGPRYENPYLQWAVHANRWDVVEKLVNEICAAKDFWGWKLPKLIDHLELIDDTLPVKGYIFVKKNINSVARRKSKFDPNAYDINVERIKKQYLKIDEFARSRSENCLILDYENIMDNLELAVNKIAELNNIKLFNVKEVIAGVLKDAEDYKVSEYHSTQRTSLHKRLSKIIDDNDVKRPN